MAHRLHPELSGLQQPSPVQVEDGRVTIFTLPSGFARSPPLSQRSRLESSEEAVQPGCTEIDGSTSTIAADTQSPGNLLESALVSAQRPISDTAATIPPEAIPYPVAERAEFLTLSHLSADEASKRLGNFAAQGAGLYAKGNGNLTEWPKIGAPSMPTAGHSSEQASALLYQMRAGDLPPPPAEVGMVPKPVCLSRTRMASGISVIADAGDAQASSHQDRPAAATSSVGEQMGYLPLCSPRRETSNGVMSFPAQAAMSDALGGSHVAQPGGMMRSVEVVSHRVIPPQRVVQRTSLPLAPVPERTVLHRHGTAPASVIAPARQTAGLPIQSRSLHPEFANYSQREVNDRQTAPIPQAVAMTQRAAAPATLVRGESFTTRTSMPAPRPALVQRSSSFAHCGTPTMSVRRTYSVSEVSSSHVGFAPRAEGSVRYVATSVGSGVLPRNDSHAVPVYRVQTFSGQTMQSGQSFAYPASGSFAYGGSLSVSPPIRAARAGEIHVAEDVDYVTRVHNMRRAVHESYGW